MIRKLLLASVVTLCAITACGDDEDDGGSGGRGGSAGRGGTAGKGGTGSGGIAGTGGTLGGSGGQGGTAGMAGTAGTGGAAGADGSAGKGGTAGSAGADGGAGKGGTAGSAGADGGVPEGGDASDGGLVDAALRVHLRFDDGTGTTASDSSGNDFHGTLHNATWATGRVGGAVDLANNDDRQPSLDGGGLDPAYHIGKQYVSLPPNIMAPCNDVTVALWVRLRSLTGFTRVLDLDGGVNGFIYLTATAGGPANPGLLFNIFRNPPNSDQNVAGVYPAPDAGGTLLNQWHHYAITLSGTVARAYFDGVQVGQNLNMTFNPSQVSIRPDGGAGGEPHAWLGRSLFPQFDPYLNAQLDELRISCRAYTAAEIAQLAE